MGVLTRKTIADLLSKDQLLLNARKVNNEFDIQSSSYDLSIGIVVSKSQKSKIFQKRIETFEYDPSKTTQKTITLGPGQMIYVVTHESINMPKNMCGTVFSRNSLALDGILALNTGHIDPGYKGPITIKLINLRSTDWTFSMGKAIFTITFQTLDNYKEDETITYKSYSKQDLLDKVIKATDISLNNALYDLALLREFVKEDEFGRALRKWLFKSVWGLVAFIFTGVLTLIGLCVSIMKLADSFGFTTWIKDLLNISTT